jgi:molybdenum cofactor cytidylyltransferase
MYNENMSLTIARGLRADLSDCIAFTGSGGKTTALFQLARTLPQPVIVTATTHLGAWQVGLADQHIMTDTHRHLENLEQSLKGVLLITGTRAGERTKPVHENVLNWLYEFCRSHHIPLLIEADGSRQKLLKAWAEHEPPVPVFADQVVHVVGLSAFGKILSDETVHRADLYSGISGLSMGETIHSEAIVQALLHPHGGMKNIPAHSRKVILLNQADTPVLQAAAHGMVPNLLSGYDSVLISSLLHGQIHAVHEPVAGIVLAAGESSRYGQAKQLLSWRDEPFVHVVTRTAQEAGLSPVIVVSGAHADLIESAVRDLGAELVHNPQWRSGQGGSIRTAVNHLQNVEEQKRKVGGAIFLLADQPQVTQSILRALVEKHAEGLYPVVAPMVMDQRANPVLFDRSTFVDLAALEGDTGGRAVFHKYRVEYLPWHDDRLLLDVDTPEMYQRLISDDSL